MKLSTRAALIVTALFLSAGILTVCTVSRFGSSVAAPADYPPANWDRLTIGMPQAEVVGLLGSPSQTLPPLRNRGRSAGRQWSVFETISWVAVQLFAGGIDWFCTMSCERWEYDGGPITTPRPFLHLGSFPQAFVIYFAERKVVWFRRPTAGPLVDEGVK